MNILAEVKSFSLRIGDSICSLIKTQTHILIMSKFVRHSVTYQGLVARHSMRREKTGDKCCRFVQFAKQILAISLAVRGFHAGLQGYLEAIYR